MTRTVVTVAPNSTIPDIASLLVQHRISAVPVVTGDNQVVGIVSESDLIHRAETHTERKRKWWLEFFLDNEARARDYVKEHGLTAADVMSREVVSVDHDADLADVAETLDAKRVRRVPVLRNGRLVGIVSRADLVRALAEAKVRVPAPPASPEDAKLQAAIRKEMDSHSWLSAAFVSVEANGGEVELRGFVDSEEQARAVRVLAEGIAGAGRVRSHVRVRSWSSAA
jgi:CBS domain-containing protein